MKAYTTPNIQSYIAGEDLSSKQYTFVKFHTAEGQVVAVSGAGDIPCGILMNAPESGETADVAVPGGGAKLICDAGMTAGAFISTGADGKGEVATSASGKFIAAIADAMSNSASSANDIIPVFVITMYADRDVTDIMTHKGDMVRGGTAGAPERVALGAANTFWVSDGTDAKWSTQTLSLGGNMSTAAAFTQAGAFAFTLTLEDAAAAVVLDNANFEVENTDGTQRSFKITSAKAGNTTLTFQEDFTIGDGHNVSMTAEDAAAAVVLDNANFEVENTDGTQRSFKITSAKAGNTTLTLEENFTVGDGFDVSITAEDAVAAVVLDNANFEVENSDATQRLFKITSAKAGNTTLTFQEDFTIGDGHNVSMTAEDAAAAVVLDNANFEVESTDATQRLFKVTSAKAGNTTLTMEEDLTIGDGHNVTITAEDAAAAVVLDNANFEVENTDGTQRALKFTVAATGDRTWTMPDANGQVTVERVSYVELSAAEVMDLHNTPIELIADPGVGLYVDVISVEVLTTGTVGYDGVAAGEDFEIQYGTAGDIVIIETTGFIDQAGVLSRFVRVGSGAVSHASPCGINENVEIANSGAVYAAAGNHGLKVRTRYQVLTAMT